MVRVENTYLNFPHCFRNTAGVADSNTDKDIVDLNQNNHHQAAPAKAATRTARE